jgi:hypothetical protein
MNGGAMYSESNYKRVMALELQAGMLHEEFAALMRAKQLLERYATNRFQTLEVKQFDAYTIDATYLNVTVRFQLLLNYKDGKANGRVVCLHKYRVFEKDYFDVLGEFNIDLNGCTDLSPSTDENMRRTAGNADEIVLEFLDKAIEQGPQAFAQAKL